MKASYVACSISAFQQLCGINAIIFYAATIFEDTSLGANQANALLMGINLAGACMSYPLLIFFGRKSILIVTNLAMCVFLVIQGWSSLATDNAKANNEVERANILADVSLVMCCLFIATFEMGPGPITWLYMPEIANSQAISMATGINWTLTCIVGLITAPMVNAISGWTFIIFGVCSGVAGAFCILVLKETKGLTVEQCKKLYVVQDKTSKEEHFEIEESEVKQAELAE